MSQGAAAFAQQNTVSGSLFNLKLFVSLQVNRDFQIIQYQLLQILVYQDGLLTSSSLTVKQHSLYETT
jgi:hypothetical protein